MPLSISSGAPVPETTRTRICPSLGMNPAPESPANGADEPGRLFARPLGPRCRGGPPVASGEAVGLGRQFVAAGPARLALQGEPDPRPALEQVTGLSMPRRLTACRAV